MAAKRFLMRTIGKIMRPPQCTVFELNYINETEQIIEFANHLQVVKVKRGSSLPTLKRGMFILLDGSFKVTTHWNIETGMTANQKHYMHFIHSQLGRGSKAYEFREKLESDTDSDDLDEEQKVERE